MRYPSSGNVGSLKVRTKRAVAIAFSSSGSFRLLKSPALVHDLAIDVVRKFSCDIYSAFSSFSYHCRFIQEFGISTCDVAVRTTSLTSQSSQFRYRIALNNPQPENILLLPYGNYGLQRQCCATSFADPMVISFIDLPNSGIPAAFFLPPNRMMFGCCLHKLGIFGILFCK